MESTCKAVTLKPSQWPGDEMTNVSGYLTHDQYFQGLKQTKGPEKYERELTSSSSLPVKSQK
jgi:hypothetical protein